MNVILYFGFILIVAVTGSAYAGETLSEKPRIFVLTDIGPKHHPDDTQSLLRLLTYSNQFAIEGLVASTAAMRDRGVHPDYIIKMIEAYGLVRDNLLLHEPGFPTVEALLSTVKRGHVDSGMDAVGPGKDSEGSEWLIRAVDKEDPRPLWVLGWGGTNVLAQAAWKVRDTRSSQELAAFISKLRVYAIGDQDDSGPWIREQFPGLFLIVSPQGYMGSFATVKMVLTLGRNYKRSTFWGIGGEYPGADNDIVSEDWLRQNIMDDHGSFGAMYPELRLMMEGDTPSFLYLVNNGLNESDHPEYGGWGGRYEKQGSFYEDADDTVVGADGFRYTTNHATIWRWREAFQNDFAARLDWATRPFQGANHPPVVRLSHAETLPVESGTTVTLDARPTTDPDHDSLKAHWFLYPEAGSFEGQLELGHKRGLEVSIDVPNVSKAVSAHVILQVTDDGDPPLTRYRRIVLEIKPSTADTAD